MSHISDPISTLLTQNLSRELIMGIEEALTVGAQRAYSATEGMDKGHLPSALGQGRHFHMNESFHRALEVGGAAPSPIKGNGVIRGRSGILTLARFNIAHGCWINGRRSTIRRQMALANQAIEPLVQPELFGEYSEPSNAVAFFVACFSGSLYIQPESPTSIQIAVPSRDMKNWLFKEPLHAFLHRYEQQSTTQDDLVKPKLKKTRNQDNQDKAI